MINVNILKKDCLIKRIEIEGHANYSVKGSDIVCAGVSSVVIGCINSIDEICKDTIFKLEINEKKGSIKYNSIKSTENEQLLLRSLLISLKCIEKNYSDYININMKEVKY